MNYGKDQYAFYFEQDSIGDYFDEAGQSLMRTFLKAPLKYSRISSGFSNARFHPVLKIYRPHHVWIMLLHPEHPFTRLAKA